MAPDRSRRRQQPQERRGLLDRLFDPDRERPILKAIITAIAPILINFLTTQLPIWLADMRPLDDDEDDNIVA